jgi:hypothetical protein
MSRNHLFHEKSYGTLKAILPTEELQRIKRDILLINGHLVLQVMVKVLHQLIFTLYLILRECINDAPEHQSWELWLYSLAESLHQNRIIVTVLEVPPPKVHCILATKMIRDAEYLGWDVWRGWFWRLSPYRLRWAVLSKENLRILRHARTHTLLLITLFFNAPVEHLVRQIMSRFRKLLLKHLHLSKELHLVSVLIPRIGNVFQDKLRLVSSILQAVLSPVSQGHSATNLLVPLLVFSTSQEVVKRYLESYLV